MQEIRGGDKDERPVSTVWWEPACLASFRGPVDLSETISRQTGWEKSVRGKGEIVPRTPIRHGFGDPLKPLVGQLAARTRRTFPVSAQPRNWQYYLCGRSRPAPAPVLT